MVMPTVILNLFDYKLGIWLNDCVTIVGAVGSVIVLLSLYIERKQKMTIT